MMYEDIAPWNASTEEYETECVFGPYRASVGFLLKYKAGWLDDDQILS